MNQAFSTSLFAGLAPLGFGCCPMGRYGWGRVDEQELIDAVHTALDLNVRFFDTADIYGLGASEVTLGKALRERRSEAVVATKFGVRQVDGRTLYDTSPEYIRQALDASLGRMGFDYVDLYQMHYWDGRTPLAAVVGTLEELKREGKIREYGVTNFDPAELISAKAIAVSYSYQYSLVDRYYEPGILKLQKESEMTFLSWGTLSQGLLSGKYQSPQELDPSDRRRRDVYMNFHGTRLAAIQETMSGLREIAIALHLPSITQLAIRWIIDRIPRALPLVGIKRPDQITDAALALQLRLDDNLVSKLDELTRKFQVKEFSHE